MSPISVEFLTFPAHSPPETRIDRTSAIIGSQIELPNNGDFRNYKPIQTGPNERTRSFTEKIGLAREAGNLIWQSGSLTHVSVMQSTDLGKLVDLALRNSLNRPRNRAVLIQ